MGKTPLLAPAGDDGVKAGTAINDFGFDLLHRLDSSGNLCVSPASIALALAMVEPGARGATATEMDSVLHGLGSDANASEIVALLAKLQGDTVYADADGYPLEPDQTPTPGQAPLAELTVSNQAFVQKGLTLQAAYLEALSSRFGAGVGLLDFAADAESARLTINKWASDRTHGRIPNVLQPGDVDPATRLALANAIYLNAAWQDPFDPAKTASRAFKRADGSTVKVPTMAAELLATYSSGPGWRAIKLPYVDAMSMIVVVPDEMSSFIAGANAAEFSKIASKLTSGYMVDFTMPRFSTESRLSLGDLLAAMGMASAFDPAKADLSGIDGSPDIVLDKVIHQANIDVVEEGTTASAVTVVGGRGMGLPPPPVTFHVDRPFLYFIQDSASGAILFMGRIDDPSAGA